MDLIDEATPPDATDVSLVDNTLRLLIEERGITLDTFVSAERRASIVANAPPELEAEDAVLQLFYRRGKPLVRHFTIPTITALTNDVFLPDGRLVEFVYEGRVCSLTQLQEKLGIPKTDKQ
jgi:hypothetical protein